MADMVDGAEGLRGLVSPLSPQAFGVWHLVLPFDKPLSMNDRFGSHFHRSAEVGEWRDAVFKLAKAQRIPACERIRVTLIWEPPDRDRRGRRSRPRRDPLNLVATLKVVQDGLVDAGVIPDDTVAYMDSVMPLIDAPAPGSRTGTLTAIVERLR